MTALAVPATATDERTSAHPSIPFTRLVSVELRKMLDTRSGFWLMASIVITSVLATASLILFADDSAIVYDNFAAAIGMPMTVILPMVAILSVTGEWSQRSGLTTFTLVPHRGKVIGSKAAATALVGVVSMLVALAVGALGNLLGAAITGVDPVWNISVTTFLLIIVGDLLGMFLGFMLGVLTRNSAAAIVTYFVVTMVLPGLSQMLAAYQDWYRSLQPWIDFELARGELFSGMGMTSEQWAHLATSGTIWLLAPLTVGLLILRRSEVK